MAPLFNNTELNNVLKQIEQIQKNNSTSVDGSKKGSSYDDIAWFNNAIAGTEEVASNDNSSEQKVNGLKNVLDGLLGAISFSKNQNAQANKEVKKNSDAIDNNEKAAEKKAQEIQASVEKMVSSISDNTASINDALAAIEKLGNNGDFAKIQEQIQEQLDKIDQAKEDLKDPEKRDQALETISVAASVIDGLVANMQDVQGVIAEQNAIVEENINNISELITESTNKITEGISELQQFIQKGTVIGADSTRLTTQGGIDVPTGNAEVKAGEAINSNVFSASL